MDAAVKRHEEEKGKDEEAEDGDTDDDSDHNDVNVIRDVSNNC